LSASGAFSEYSLSASGAFSEYSFFLEAPIPVADDVADEALGFLEIS
jgi:hypothetical protein